MPVTSKHLSWEQERHVLWWWDRCISSMLRPACHPCGLLLRFRVPEGAERLAVSWRVSHYMILWTSAGANIRWRVHLPFGFLTLKMWDTCQNCRPRGAEQRTVSIWSLLLRAFVFWGTTELALANTTPKWLPAVTHMHRFPRGLIWSGVKQTWFRESSRTTFPLVES